MKKNKAKKMNKTDFFNRHQLSDNWIFETAFNGDTEEESYLNLRIFLINEGFGDIPLPLNARRLWWDYIKPVDGIFGYFVWHPIKITQNVYQEKGLHLIICNENYPNHMAFWEDTYGKEL